MNLFQIRKAGHTLESPADWFRLAPPPDAEDASGWSAGRASYELARSFFSSDGQATVPADLDRLLASSAAMGAVKCQSMIPEYLVKLDDQPGGSQRCHALLSGTSREGRTAILLHARTDEGFGPLIGDQLKRSKPGSQWAQRMTRLTEAVLGRPLEKCLALRSGLVLLAAAALRAAENEKSGTAFLVFQEFRPHPARPAQVKQQTADLDAFTAALGGKPLKPNVLSGPHRVPGGHDVPASVPLFLGRTLTLLSKAPG